MARQLNYRPNSNAAGLATGKSRQIGHVIPLSDHQMINPHFSDFIAGAGETFSTASYDMLLRVVSNQHTEEVYRDFANRVDGVIVHGPLIDDPRIELLQDLGLPFVVHGRSGRDEESYSWLDVNNKRAFQRATAFLAESGHRRIALVNGLEAMTFAHRRRLGYQDGLSAHGIAFDPTLLSNGDMDEPYGYRSTSDLLSLQSPPTAILYASVLPAMGGVRALADAGLSPGRDVSIITFDDQLSFLHPGSTGSIPHLTCLRSSIRSAGRRVAEMLLEQIDGGAETPVHELWEAEFVIGQSTARQSKQDRRDE